MKLPRRAMREGNAVREMIRGFVGLALAWAAAEKLLPEGRKRQAARMVCGLLSLLLWTEGIAALMGKADELPSFNAPVTLVKETSAAFGESGEAVAEASACRQAEQLAQGALRKSGLSGEVSVTMADGRVASVTVRGANAASAGACVAAALSVAEELVRVE